MKKKPYRILVSEWTFGKGVVDEALEVMAEPVNIPGWGEIKSIIHRHPNNPGAWHVSDSETGALIGYAFGTKQEAIEDTIDNLSLKTMDDIRKYQKRTRRKYGKLDELPLSDSKKGVIA